MKHRSLLFIFLLFPALLLAQKKTGKELIDSLIKSAATAPADTNKVKTLVSVANTAYTIDPDAGIKYGTQALGIAEDIGYQMGIARANMALGLNYDAKFNIAASLDCYFKASKIYEQLGNKRGQYLSLWGMGNEYNAQKDFAKSLEYDLKALKLAVVAKDSNTMFSLYGNIGNNYLFRPVPDANKALEYYSNALSLAEKRSSSMQEGVELLNMGNAHTKLKNYALAFAYYARSRNHMVKEEAKLAYSRCLNNTAEAYIKMVTDSAYTIVPDSFIAASKSENIARAIVMLKEGIVLGNEIGDIDGTADALVNLSEAQQLSGDFKSALESRKKAETLRDSINSQESNVKIAQLTNQRDLEMKDKDIKIERLKSTIFIFGIVVLLIVLAVGLLKLRKQIRSNKQLSSEKEQHLAHIRAQDDTLKDIAFIQSHHVRGPVTTILGLSQHFNYDNPEDPHNRELMAGIASVAVKLDHTVTEVISKENNIKKKTKGNRG